MTNWDIIKHGDRWYVLHTHPKQENRAESNLKVLGVSVINPKIKERRYNPFIDHPAYVAKSLFPRYIFARFNLEALYHKIRFTRGVATVVGPGERPTAIDEEIVALIQSRIKEDGFVQLEEEIRPGDKVKIMHGPLKDFAGVFEREMKDSARIRILLQTVSWQAHVAIEREKVKKVR
jgi:transcription elongation factor/antiterminator RfaH